MQKDDVFNIIKKKADETLDICIHCGYGLPGSKDFFSFFLRESGRGKKKRKKEKKKKIPT